MEIFIISLSKGAYEQKKTTKKTGKKLFYQATRQGQTRETESLKQFYVSQ